MIIDNDYDESHIKKILKFYIPFLFIDYKQLKNMDYK